MLMCPQIASSQAVWSPERARVTRHLKRAESRARANDVDQFPFLRRLVRALLLDELAHYRQKGRFPLNFGFADNTPCFVDIAGTRCAMAHLLDASGEHALASRIARERNHARVCELADEPRLVAWLGAAGISLEEAAAIQPSYCAERAACVCGGETGGGGGISPLTDGAPADGVLVGTMLRANLDRMVMRIDATYGDAGSFAVGTEIEAVKHPYRSDLPMATPGSTLVVPVHSEAADASAATLPTLNAIVLSADGSFTCGTRDQKVGPLQPAQLAEALQADDCPETLASFNPKWDDRRCDDGWMCAAGPRSSADAPTSLSILMVLASALVARRFAR